MPGNHNNLCIRELAKRFDRTKNLVLWYARVGKNNLTFQTDIQVREKPWEHNEQSTWIIPQPRL